MKFLVLIAAMILSQAPLAFADNRTVKMECSIISSDAGKHVSIEKQIPIDGKMAVTSFEVKGDDGLDVTVSALVYWDPSKPQPFFGVLSASYSDGIEVSTNSYTAEANISLSNQSAQFGKLRKVGCGLNRPL